MTAPRLERTRCPERSETIRNGGANELQTKDAEEVNALSV